MFDCETGGLDETANPITEIALVNFDLDTYKVNWEYQTFVQPYNDLVIDPIVYQKTLVTEKDVLNGITSKELVKQLIKLFKQSNTSNGKNQGNTIMAGHNVIAFDRRFIEYLFLTETEDIYDYISREFHDTLVDARRLWRGENDKHNLGACCKRINYDLTGAHGAMNDTRATFELYRYLTNRLRSNDSSVIKTKTGVVINQHRKFFNY